MSGGTLGNYPYYQVSQFADELENALDNNDRPDECGYASNYGEEVVTLLRSQLPVIRRLAEVMRHIDYLYSGDHGEDTFLRYMKDLGVKR